MSNYGDGSIIKKSNSPFYYVRFTLNIGNQTHKIEKVLTGPDGNKYKIADKYSKKELNNLKADYINRYKVQLLEPDQPKEQKPLATIQELYAMYTDPQNRPETVKNPNNRGTRDLYIARCCKEFPTLSAINMQSLEQFRNTLLQNGMKSRTVNGYLGALKAVIIWGWDNNLLHGVFKIRGADGAEYNAPVHPFKNFTMLPIKNIKTGGDQEPYRPLTYAELQRLYTALHASYQHDFELRPDYIFPMVTAVATGLRRANVVELSLQSIKMIETVDPSTKDLIAVHYFEVGKTKSGNPHQSVLSNDYLDMLNHYLEWHKMEFKGHTEWLFPSLLHPWKPVTSIRKRVDAVCNFLAFDNFSFHGTRHNNADELYVAKNLDTDEMKEHLGHATPEMSDRYISESMKLLKQWKQLNR